MIRAALAVALMGALAMPTRADEKPSAAPGRVFEMRTYVTHEGKLPALQKRFREHTNGYFRKHGMEIVGFWTPRDEKDGKANTLVYILAYPSKEAAEASWKAFGTDPGWKKVREESEADGKIVEKITSVYLDPTDYSPIK